MNKPPLQQPFSLMETFKGAFDMMVGRADGLNHMDLTEKGFWLSFWGLAITGLIDMSVYSMEYSEQKFVLQNAPPSKLPYILSMLANSLISYGVSMLALYLLCRTPQEQSRFPYVIIANNWASPLVSVAVLPLVLLSSSSAQSTPDDPVSGIWGIFIILFFAAILYAGTNLLRISLNISPGRAFGYMIITTVISVIFSTGIKHMTGMATL